VVFSPETARESWKIFKELTIGERSFIKNDLFT
jgi:hypothetical protein